MTKDCPVCNEFISWLHQRARDDVKAMQLLARFEDEEQFCEANAHYDRALFRDFMSTLTREEA